ncbi:hypothetical protein DDR33_18145 [Pararcticibacter amylolyticus]|uniref:Uncharacterized protein n=2 Tax=Pararcticibacter amylolyticus TaxID=2173175 RepID=A0A2U2PDK6_9SPHI|nr:hypothetical protein DDR33_18145 [Pararcticibacter amylolyticus]
MTVSGPVYFNYEMITTFKNFKTSSAVALLLLTICGLKTTQAQVNTQFSWGSNFRGILVDGTSNTSYVPKLVANPAWKAVAAGDDFTVFIKQDGTLWGVGNNSWTVNTYNSATDKFDILQLGNESDWAAVAVSWAHVLALKTNGELWTWGYNYGNLGDGTTAERSQFANRRLVLYNVKKIAAGPSNNGTIPYSYAISTAGNLFACGGNAKGQLGDGSTSRRLSWVLAGNDNDWVDIQAGQETGIGLKQNGTVFAWGNNLSGNLGDGTTTNRLSPQQVPSLANITQISSHGSTAFAIQNNGKLWVWGSNGSGQAGVTSLTKILTPTEVMPGSTWASVSSSSYYSMGIQTNGSLWGWGENMSGEQGNGGTWGSSTPALVDGGSSYVSVYTNLAWGGSTFAVRKGVTCTGISRVSGQSANNNSASQDFIVSFNAAITGLETNYTKYFNLTSQKSALTSATPVAGTSNTQWKISVSVPDNVTDVLSFVTQTGNGGSAAIINSITSPQNTVDRQAPSFNGITFASNNSNPSLAKNGNIISLTFSTSESVSTPSVTIGGKTATVTSTGTNAWKAVYTMTSSDTEGTFGYSISASDNLGNTGTTSSPGGITYDSTSPSLIGITRATPTASLTKATSVVYKITFSENITGLDLTDLNITAASTLTTGTMTMAQGTTAAEYNVTIPVTGDGNLQLDLKTSGNGITDPAGNETTGAYPPGQVYTIDQTKPVVSSITRLTPASANTNATSVIYKVTFSENVTGVNAPDFSTVAGSGLTAGTITVTNGSTAAEYKVTVPVTGNGTLKLNLKDTGTGIADLASNAIPGGYTSGEEYTVDQTKPAVSSIVRMAPLNSNTNATSLTYRVTFSEPVSGVDATDFSAVTSGGVSTGGLTLKVLSGREFDVTVASVSGTGDLRLDLNASGTGIIDWVSNPVSGGYNSGEAYSIDQTPPSVSIVRQTPSTENINVTSVTYRVTFSKKVNNVDASDFAAIVVSGNIGKGSITVAAVSPAIYDVTLPSLSGNGTLRLDLKPGTDIYDDFGNAAPAYTAGEVYTIDQVVPAVSSIVKQSPAAANTNASSVTYKVTFTENVTGVKAAHFNATTSGGLTAGTVTLTAGSTDAEYLVSVPVTGSGAVRLDLKAGSVISDAAGNTVAGAYTSGEFYTIDQAKPQTTGIVRYSPATATTNAASVTYKVTFSENVNGVDATAFNATAGPGLTAGTLTVSQGSTAAEYMVSIPVSGSGSLRLDVKSSGTAIADLVGNTILGGYSLGEIYTIDQDVPAVSSIVRQTPATAATNASPVVYKVTFNKNVTGVDAPDFIAAAGTGLTTGTISVSNGANAAQYLVSIPATGNGTLRLDLKASGTGISDATGNAIAGGYTSGEVYTIDQTKPVLTSIARQTPLAANTNAASVTYKVTFSENVTGVNAPDFSAAAGSGLTAGTITVVNGSNAAEYLVTVPVTGNGTLRLDLKASGTGITDAAGNAIPGGFTSGEMYTIDQALPAVSSILRQIPAAAVTNAASVTYKVTFSENVSGVDAADFSTTAGSGLTAGALSVTAGASAAEYTVTIPVTGNGTLRLNLKSSGTGITDGSGNTVSGGYSSGEIYTIDQITPAATSITRLTPSTAKANAVSVTYKVTFSEIVSGVDAADFSTVAGTGLTAGTLSVTEGSSAAEYLVSVPVTGNGTLRLDLKASGTGISDPAGNMISSGYTTGESYTIDQTYPVVAGITRQMPSAANNNATSVIYKVLFSKNVSGVDAADFTAVTAAGLTAGTISVSPGSSAAEYLVTVPVTGNGTIRLDLKDSGTGIADPVGNAVQEGYNSGEVYTIDQTRPLISNIARQTPSTGVTNASSVTYKVTFSENVSGVNAPDFTATASTGVVTGTLTVTPGATAAEYLVSMPVAGNGTLRLDLKASGTGIYDASGNAVAGAFTSGEVYTIDQVKPSVGSILRENPLAANVNAASVTYKVTFSEPVLGVDVTDFYTTAGTGLTAGTISIIQGATAAEYLVTVPVTGSGTLRLDLKSGGTGIADAGGNAIMGGYTSGQVYTIDQALPAVTGIVRQSPAAALTNAASVTYKITFSKNVSGVDASDFSASVTGLTAGTISVNPGSTAAEYMVTVPVTGSGTIRMDLNTSGTGISDATGNAIAGGYTSGEAYTVDQVKPVISTISIASANTNTSMAKEGDMVTVSFLASEELKLNITGGYKIQIGSQMVTVKADAARSTPTAFWYKAEASMNKSEAADASGNIKIAIDGYSDPAGNTGVSRSSTTDGSKVTLDTSVPGKPEPPGKPGNDGHVDTSTPTISGVTEPNATVEIYVDGVKVGEAKADANGNWQYTFNPPLSEGRHEIVIRIRNSAGTVSDPAPPVVVYVDTEPPVQPMPPDKPGNNGHVNTATPTISGTAEPNAIVEVYVDGVKVGEAKADANGKWQYTFNPPLSEGEHEIRIRIRDEAGNKGEPSSPVIIIVDIDIPDQPEPPGIPGNNGHVNTDTPTINGVVAPNVIVEIYIDGVKVGETRSDENGKWQYTFNPALAQGEHEVTIRIRDEAGNTGEPSAPVKIIVDTKVPEKPKTPEVTGSNNGKVETNTPTLTGTAEPGTTVEIYVDGKKVGEAKVGADGKWEYTFTEPITEGEHTIRVVIVDAAGNRSERANAVIINVAVPKGNTTIQPAAIPAKTYGDAAFKLEATSNSPARFTYWSSNKQVAAINENGIVEIYHAGTTTLTISQASATGFDPATVSVELVIAKAGQRITLMPLPEMERHGAPYSLTVSSSSGLPVEVISSNPLVAGISGTSLSPLGIGTARIIASHPGNEDYLPATAETELKVFDPVGEEIRINKIITPNGDGINDELYIEGLSNVTEHRLVLFNRNGTRMFDSKTYPTGDIYIPHGRSFAGQLYHTGYLPAGTYFYTFEYKKDGVSKLMTGYIVLKY